MKIRTTVQKWGNSLAVRITGSLKTITQFTANMPIEIEANEKGLIIRPLPSDNKKVLIFSEAQLLKGLTPKTAHADVLFHELK